MLKIKLAGNQIQARAGSMVAYQGQINFEHAGSGGVSRFIKKAISGDGVVLMSASGQGDLFLANQAHKVHLIYLENEEIIVDSEHMLAFDPSGIDWDIQALKGGTGGMMAGGLFNLTLKGSGWVALTSDGRPLLLNTGEAGTFVDRQALIAWSSGLRTEMKRDIKVFKSLTGRTSGESFQIGFQGQGWVLVQPSEGLVLPTTSSSSSGGSLFNG